MPMPTGGSPLKEGSGFRNKVGVRSVFGPDVPLLDAGDRMPEGNVLVCRKGEFREVTELRDEEGVVEGVRPRFDECDRCRKSCGEDEGCVHLGKGVWRGDPGDA